MDYYSKLGVNKQATDAEIKKAYRDLAKKWHPDLNPGDEKAEARFKEISEAYEILGDKDRRSEYDLYGETPRQQQQQHYNFDKDEILRRMMKDFDFGFSPFASAGFPHGRHQYQQTNPNVKIQISIDIRDTLVNQKKIIEINGKTVELDIPRGIENGAVLRYTGLGETRYKDLPPGDLYVNVLVNPDKTFQRHGNNVIRNVEIDCFAAMLGTEVNVETIEGKTLKIKIKPGTQYGAVLKVAGHGCYVRNSANKGDMILQVLVTIPTVLSAYEKQILEDLKGQHINIEV